MKRNERDAAANRRPGMEVREKEGAQDNPIHVEGRMHPTEETRERPGERLSGLSMNVGVEEICISHLGGFSPYQ